MIKDNYALNNSKDYKYELPVSANCDVLYVNRKFDRDNQLLYAENLNSFNSISNTLATNNNLNKSLVVSNDCFAEERVGVINTYKNPIGFFNNEEAVSYLGKISELSYIRENVNWFTMMPYPDNDYNFVSAETWGVASNEDASREYAAMLVLSYLLSDDAQEMLYIENESYIPLNKNILDVYVNETHKNDNLEYLFDITIEE